jgi:hypothetical protein
LAAATSEAHTTTSAGCTSSGGSAEKSAPCNTSIGGDVGVGGAPASWRRSDGIGCIGERIKEARVVHSTASAEGAVDDTASGRSTDDTAPEARTPLLLAVIERKLKMS